MLYAAGAFPKWKNDVKGQQPTSMDGSGKWEIEFDPTARPEFATNPTSPVINPLFTLITKDQGWHIMIDFKTEATGIYKFYAQVYSLLGSVEESQWEVFDRLTDGFNFFRKSYYLNANTPDCVNSPQACGEEGLRSAGGFYQNKLVRDHSFLMHYILKLDFWAKIPTGSFPNIYDLGHPNTPIDMTTMDSHGLFQLATVPDDVLKTLGNGLDVYQGWDAPSNYFSVNFNAIARCSGMTRPCVHSLITTQCPQMPGNNCVWPAPTPKYQTRLYP
jgi:hypothetical protein